MKVIVFLAWASVFISSALAQDPQVRVVAHPMLNLDDNWYLSFWSVSNIRSRSPDNTNIFVGIGYQASTWWTEFMVQQQWNRSSANTTLELRYQKRFTNKLSVYLEPAVFLNKKAFYEFVIIERPLWRRLSLGAETENVHQAGKDVWAAGPRISFPIATPGKWKVNGAVAYRFRNTGQDEPRLYLGFTRRFP